MITWFARSLAHNWDLLWQMVVTDLRGRYVGSTLGLFWTVIHPLVMILIYTLVFAQVMATRLPGMSDVYAYSTYLCSALLPWIAFQEVVTRATTLFPDNANLVRKVAFPKVILYGFVTLSAAINMVLALGLFLLVMVATGHSLSPKLVLWVPIIAIQLAFGLGIGIIVSVLHVFLRDTAQLVSVLFVVWFWTTPIVYVENILPGWLLNIERLNPMYHFGAAHRSIVLYGQAPGAARTLLLVALAFSALAMGTLAYRRFRTDILDEL